MPKNHLSSTPIDVFLEICSFLTAVDLCSLRLTCRDCLGYLSSTTHLARLSHKTRQVSLKERTLMELKNIRIPSCLSLCLDMWSTNQFKNERNLSKILRNNPDIVIAKLVLGYDDDISTTVKFLSEFADRINFVRSQIWIETKLTEVSVLLRQTCKELEFDGQEFCVPFPLTECWGNQLSELTLSHWDCTFLDLSSLSSLPNLRTLSLIVVLNLQRLPALSQCTFVHLEYVRELEDINGLRGVPKICIVQCPCVRDIDPLRQTTVLTLDRMILNNIQAIIHLPCLKLKRVTLSNEHDWSAFRNSWLEIDDKFRPLSLSQLASFEFVQHGNVVLRITKKYASCFTRWTSIVGAQYLKTITLTVQHNASLFHLLDFSYCTQLTTLQLSCSGRVANLLRLPDSLLALTLTRCDIRGWKSVPPRLRYLRLNHIRWFDFKCIRHIPTIEVYYSAMLTGIGSALTAPDTRIQSLVLDSCVCRFRIPKQHNLQQLRIIDCDGMTDKKFPEELFLWK